MDYSIRIADWCSKYSAGVRDMLTKSSRRATLVGAADAMLKRIREHGRITPRDLYRTYDCQRKELHDPVLEELINTGKVRCVDGFIEVVESTPVNQSSLPTDADVDSG
jgi:hypothetical protein